MHISGSTFCDTTNILFNEYKMNGDNMLKEIMELIFVVIVFCGVLGLSYYVTKKFGSINRKIGFNKNMEIIEILPLLQGQFLYIVKVGGKYLLLGCSQKGNISYIDELDEQQIILHEEKGIPFQEQFMHFMKGKQVKEDEHKEE